MLDNAVVTETARSPGAENKRVGGVNVRKSRGRGVGRVRLFQGQTVRGIKDGLNFNCPQSYQLP
jgi:hypothetical protein